MKETATCPNCNQEVKYEKKDIYKKVVYEEPLAFTRIFKEYHDYYIKCPKCGGTFADLKVFVGDNIYHGGHPHTPKREEYTYDI